MIYIGNHVSVSKGYLAMGKHEKKLGGNTFAFFPRNPRGGKSKAVPDEDVGEVDVEIASEPVDAVVEESEDAELVDLPVLEAQSDDSEFDLDDLEEQASEIDYSSAEELEYFLRFQKFAYMIEPTWHEYTKVEHDCFSLIEFAENALDDFALEREAVKSRKR